MKPEGEVMATAARFVQNEEPEPQKRSSTSRHFEEQLRQRAVGQNEAVQSFPFKDISHGLYDRELVAADVVGMRLAREAGFDGIIGRSSALRKVLQMIEQVAVGDSSVLLLGETGTGKELIARAIHNRSGRRDRSFVKLNCAAIPSGLLESELFGHESGAFSRALAQKSGRLELADQGTLFLDEVGDIPIEIQPKLLRALQGIGRA